ncbi:hypothetical protein EW026_g1800 [Hermanssonia centrifuga]|uniref:Kelch repeat protein n=1 Tax=Hermanssonia centrifuga TaxID=98765 RepID=A0A4S4KQ94_9APHY|nr:hypothetical protein EW026_g1800 [Hermanssonia centrifuga]
MPNIRTQYGFSVSRLVRHWGSKAYLFDGTKKLWQFDMETEKWNSLKTTFGRTWPYPKNDLTSYFSGIIDGKLYIFGGADDITKLGCNTFMELDLATLKWEHTSGTSANVPCTREPNLRTLASMWAVPSQKKLYLFGGSATRSAAYQSRLAGGDPEDYTYEDFWSFDIPSRKWCRERWRGNFVCPRTEMASDYNPVLGRGIVYGGYNASMDSATHFGFAFYGDTFLFDPETKTWQHVIAKGFPSYRALASMISDPDTGITYLYGG